ncbi:MAG: PspC domain-containing protein [Cytophagales bacterium]|nr:PspC domain-containing protein [Bernardetiaceae bacterium]MDW8211229.1 PspC domain-containing protein [Cytophagales bacterium]
MKSLTKSAHNKVLTGVCGGLGQYFGIDPALIRIGFVLATLFGIGAPILLYIVLAIFMPDETYY